MRWFHFAGIGVGIALVGATTGFLGGTLFDQSEAEATTLVSASVLDCPMGIELTEYQQGTRVYAVARSESGSWIQVRDLDNPALRVWIQAGAIGLDTQVDLPIASCEADGFVIAADTSTTTTTLGTTTSTLGTTTTTTSGETSTTSSGQTTSSSAGGTTTTTRATTTSSTGTTAPPADTTPPSLTASASELDIWESSPGTCTGMPKSAILTAVATDTGSGVDTVVASWVVEGTSDSEVMSGSGNTYTSPFGPFDWPTIPDNTVRVIDITITATDNVGNASTRALKVAIHSVTECFG